MATTVCWLLEYKLPGFFIIVAVAGKMAKNAEIMPVLTDCLLQAGTSLHPVRLDLLWLDS